jgi:phosphoribosyl 1,2-cyclic phosphodiesterase
MNDIEICVLSSGSRANATLVCHGETSLLIDCGLASKTLNARLREVGKDPEQITDIVVTHEHSDHVHGVCMVAKKTGAKVWVTEKTASAWRAFATSPPAQRAHFQSGVEFQIGTLTVRPFSTSHDAIDPVGLRISNGDTFVGYCTDLGHVTAEVRQNLRGLTALIIESNHEPSLLQIAPYPAVLKARISSCTGHLSNQVASALIEELLGEESSSLEYLVAAHVSEKANDPLLVRDTLSIAIERASTRRPELVVANAFGPAAPRKISNGQKGQEMTKGPNSATTHAERLLELL